MKRMPIDALLSWAYREELPKDDAPGFVDQIGYMPAWGGVERYGELMTLIDGAVNQWGVVPSFVASEGPHPDARVIGAAVRSLDEVVIGMPDAEEWAPLADMGDLGPHGAAAVARALEKATIVEADGTRVMRGRVSELVRICAILQRPPVWQAERPELKVEMISGRERWFRRVWIEGVGEVEVDGYDRRAKRPYGDAYRKHYLDPDPMEAARARAEYEVWHAAMAVLVEELASGAHGVMSAHVAEASAHPVRPWEIGAVDSPRVWKDLRAPKCEPRQSVNRGAQARRKIGA